MEKTTLIGLGIVALALLVAGCASTSQQPQQQQPPSQQPPQQQPPTQTPETYDVQIKNFAFSPADINIKQGDTITWTNMDSAPHTIDLGFKKSGTLSQGNSFSYTFSQKGTYDYICGIHPSMKGTVTVT